MWQKVTDFLWQKVFLRALCIGPWQLTADVETSFLSTWSIRCHDTFISALLTIIWSTWCIFYWFSSTWSKVAWYLYWLSIDSKKTRTSGDVSMLRYMHLLHFCSLSIEAFIHTLSNGTTSQKMSKASLAISLKALKALSTFLCRFLCGPWIYSRNVSIHQGVPADTENYYGVRPKDMVRIFSNP